MNKLKVIGSIAILLFVLQKNYAQNCGVNIIVSESTMEDQGGGGTSGDNYTMNSVSVSIKDDATGSITSIGSMRNYSTTSPYTISNSSVKITSNAITVIIRHKARYYKWWIGGSSTDNIDKEDPKLITLDANGTSGSVKVMLTDNHQSISYVTFSINITPFRPVITSDISKKCYNNPFTLTANPKSPSFYTSSCLYEWQYGLSVSDTILNYSFTNSFVYSLADKLSSYFQDCSYNCPSDMSTIFSAIVYNTNYKFMAEYLYLYDNYEYYKNSIAYTMLEGILNQNYSVLDYRDQDYLDTYFVEAFESFSSSPAPCSVGTKIDWKNLDGNGASITFDPATKLSPLSDKTLVNFQVRAKTGTKIGSYSPTDLQNILPAPPSATTINASLSCLGKQTGVISVSGITSPVYTDKFTYRITENSEPNTSPEKNESFGGMPVEFTGSSFTATTKQKAGSYYLYLTYSDASINNCLVGQHFTVLSHPDLNYSTNSSPVECPGGSNGSITVSILNGAGNYNINVNGQTASNTNTFSGLSYGTFTIVVSDNCTSKSSSETVSQPNPVVIIKKTASVNHPNCISPANGGIGLDVTGGSGVYDYYIYDAISFPSGTPLVTAKGESGKWSNYSLSGGNYILSAKDHSHPQCFGDTLIIKLNAASSLSLSDPVNTAVKCFGENTGAIAISASGGSGNYIYFLTDSDKINYYAGKFSNLFAGTYKVNVQNANSLCKDVVQRVVNLATASKIEITLIPRDVLCFEGQTGQITATITGGNGNSSKEWQKRENGEWGWHAGYVSPLTNQYSGEYRLRVTDTGCSPVYETITINQPLAALSFQNAILHDVRCYGEKGNIEVEASGGTGEYNFFKKLQTTYSEYQSGSSIDPGTYSLKVMDANECEAEWDEDITITSPESPLDFNNTLSNYNGFNISCANGNNGSVSVNATGGNGPGYEGYSYLLQGFPMQASPLFTGLTSVPRSLKVTDARGCEVVKNISLTQPTPVNLTVKNVGNISCFGLSTGQITVEGSGGIAPYHYKIGSGNLQTGGVFTNLPATSYQFFVQDTNGCLGSVESEVTHIYEQIHTSLSPTDVRCFGENNGLILASISGGSGNFDMSWERKINGSWQTKQLDFLTIDSLEPANYRFKVVDRVGCPALFDSTEIRQPNAPISVSDATLHDIRCFGEKGNIDILAVGGNGTYQYFYSKNNGSNQVYIPGSPLEKGTYHLNVKDYKGCEASWPDDINITEPDQPLNFSYTLSDYNGFNVSCNGNNNGRVAVKTWGGNGSSYNGYTYLLSTKPAQLDSVFTELTAGGYQLTVNDNRGCSVSRSLSLTQPSASLNLNVSDLLDTKCFNDSTGKIALSASGGVQPFKYSIGQESFVSDNEFVKLPVGKYYFTVKDLNGCISNLDTVIRHILPVPTITLIPQEISCFNHSDGKIQANLSGGSGNFALLWLKKINGDWADFKSDDTEISLLAPGDYRLQATDKAGCPSIYDSTVVYQHVTPLLIDRVNFNDIRCFGESGKIDIQASGSNGGYIYQYSKDNSAFINYIPGSPLSFANYKLRVVDSKECETDWPETITITTPSDALGFTWSLKDFNGYNVSCFGNNDGRLAVKAYGGNGSNYLGYNYLLSGRSAQADTVFDALTANVYDLTVTDARGCSLSKPVTLVQAASEVKLWASDIDPVKCHYDTNGKITLAALGGKSPYTYQLENNSYVESKEFGGLAVGNYHFTVRDINGCRQFLDTSVINTIPRMEVTGTIAKVKCFGQNNGVINVAISGGASPFTYYWKENARITPDIDKLYKGKYTVSVIDAAGCMAEQLFEVEEPALPLSVTASSEAACAETSNGIIHPTAIGGTPPYFYSVDDSTDVKEVTQLLSYGGIHNVFAADWNNCKSGVSITVGVRNNMPSPNFMVATSRYALDTLVIKDVSIPKPDSLTWIFSSDARIIGSNSLEPKIKYDATGIYPVKMIGHFGTCDYEVEKFLNISPFDPDVVIRNNFSTGIENVELSPNPNNGQFKIKVKLFNKQQVSIKVIDMYSKIWHTSRYPACMELEQDIVLPGVVNGTYVLWIITDNDSKAVRFVVSQ